MSNKNDRIRQTLTRTEDMLTQKSIGFWVIALAMILVYCSVIELSLGLEFYVIAFVLMVIHLRKEPRMKFAATTFALSVTALAMLLFSGKFGEMTFNSPIHHALKFVNLFVVHILVILMFRMEDDQKLKIFAVLGGVVVLSTLISLYCILFMDEYAVRYFEERGFYQVFDFNQMYAVPFLATALGCYLMAKGEKKTSTVVYVVIFALMALCVVLSLYTTALLLLAMGLVLAFLFSQYHRSPKRFRIIMGVLIGLVAVCFLFRQQVADLVYAVTEPLNFLLRARLRSVADMILGTSGDNWYAPDRRNELAGYSLTAFSQHPILGVGYAGYEYGVIGCHQEWFDMLGVGGVVGMACFLAVMGVMTVQTFRNARTSVDKASFLICLVMFVVLGFLNPCLNLPVLIAVYIVAPNVSVLPIGNWAQMRDSLKMKWGKKK